MVKKEEKPLAYEAAQSFVLDAVHAPYRWDVDQQSWFIRSPISGVWERDGLNMVESHILKAANTANPQDTGAWARYFRWVAQSDSRLVMRSSEWDAHLYAFGAPSGVFELVEGCALEPWLDMKVTKMVGAAPGGDCPRWEAFMLEACGGDAEVVAFLKRWAGYALSGLTIEHCILFVHGPGGNGKSVFVDTLRHAWGAYARTLPMDALMEAKNDRHPAEIAMLRGARLAIANETQEGRRWDDAKLKQLTGGDVVVARHMRQDWFEFKPCFKLLVVGNHAPQIATVDDAMRRRLYMVPFVNKPAKPDRGLAAALQGEAGGILRWAMEGFAEYALEGLNPPEKVLQATQAYLDEQDTVGGWLKDECVLGSGWASSKDIYASWARWCGENGIHPKSMRRLAGDLARRGVVPERTATARGFKNITLVTRRDTLMTHSEDEEWVDC